MGPDVFLRTTCTANCFPRPAKSAPLMAASGNKTYKASGSTPSVTTQEKALNGIAAGRVKSSAQHAAVDKGRSAGLFEERGFENNPENIRMPCGKAAVGLRLEYCSLVGSPPL